MDSPACGWVHICTEIKLPRRWHFINHLLTYLLTYLLTGLFPWWQAYGQCAGLCHGTKARTVGETTWNYNAIKHPGYAVVATKGIWHVMQPEIGSELWFCLPHLHSMLLLQGSLWEYCHDIWYEKTRMVWLPNGENFLKTYLYSQMCQQMDRQTPRDGIGRACIASHGKKLNNLNENFRQTG